jgi:hypothetical protein
LIDCVEAAGGDHIAPCASDVNTFSQGICQLDSRREASGVGVFRVMVFGKAGGGGGLRSEIRAFGPFASLSLKMFSLRA